MTFSVKSLYALTHNLKVKNYDDIKKLLKFVLRKSNVEGFWDKDHSLQSFEIYMNDKKILYVSFKNMNKGKCVFIYELYNNSLANKNMIVGYNISAKDFNYLNVPTKFDFIPQTINEVCFVDVELNLDSQYIQAVKDLRKLKMFTNFKFVEKEKLPLTHKINLLKITKQAIEYLNEIGFVEKEIPKYTEIELQFTELPIKTSAQYGKFGSIMQFNSVLEWNKYSFAIVFIHEFSHYLFDKYSSHLMRKDILNLSVFSQFKMVCEKVVHELKITPSTNLHNIQQSTEIKQPKIDYLLNVDEVFARHLEYKYYKEFCNEAKNNIIRWKLWYFTDHEVEEISTVREKYDNFIVI